MWGALKMKKMIISTCVFVVFCLCISFIVLPVLGNTYFNRNNDTNTSSHSLSDTSKTAYIVKEFEGYIAVFNGDKPEPFRVTDVEVKSLPVMDQNMLSDGIYVYSQSELNEILEDYCS